MSLNWMLNPSQLETSKELPEALLLRRKQQRKNFSALKREKLESMFEGLPEIGESFHIVSNGKFDFWSFIPVMAGRMAGPVRFHGSTWTINREAVVEMMQLFDKGKFSSITMLTGTYFKRREPAVYATLVEGLMKRGQTFRAFENHAKVALLSDGVTFLVIEGSANFTANPRVENYVVSNDRELWEFHAGWMEKMAHAKE